MLDKSDARQSEPIALLCPECGLELGEGVAVCPKDGTVIMPTPDVGDLFEDKYEFVERRAAGAMGIVFKARQKALNRMVAIKLLNSLRPSESTVRRFQQEAQALAGLDHPNLVKVYELGVTSHKQFFSVMEFIDGKALDEVLVDQLGHVSLKKALNIMAQVCAALEYVHGKGIFHRDLKPSNIMLINPEDENPHVKLVDFGVAKVIDNPQTKSLTQTGDFFGTPLYMSPEQAKGVPVDQRSDLYSAGCVMYELLTGQPPFSGSSAIDVILKHAGEAPRSLNLMAPGLKYSNAMETLMSRLLEKDPADRYQSATELKQDLEAIASQEKTWYHVALPGLPAEKQGAMVWSIGLSIGALCSIVLICVIVCFPTFDKSMPVKSSFTKEAAAPLSLTQIEDFVNSTGGSKASKDPESEMFSEYAVLRQQDVLDLRAARAESFLRLKERKDKFITEMRAYRIDDRGLAAVPDFPLHSLDLATAYITDASIDRIVRFTDLNKLVLDGLKLNAVDCNKLLALKKLEWLSLSNCKLDDPCLKPLARFKRLDKLDLSKNSDITDTGIEFLTSAQLPVYELNLDGSGITDGGIASLQKLPDLEILRLKGTDLTDASLSEFAKLSRLRYLNLESGKVDGAGLRKFKTKTLLKLMMKGCRYTADDVRAFKKLSPQCAVYPDDEVKFN